MTEPSMYAPPAFGVGKVVGDSFSLLFQRFGTFFILAFVPALASYALSAAFLGMDVMVGESSEPEQFVSQIFSPLGILTTFILPFVLYGFSTALIVCAAYDAKLGQPTRMGLYFSIAAMRAVPIALISVLVGAVTFVGAAFFVLPGLYLASMFSVAIVAVVLESMWFGALGRSMALTKEYRWPVMGTIVLLYIAVFGIQIFFSAIVTPLAGTSIVSLVVLSAVGAVGAAILSIGLVLIYARLRELKEGVGVDTIAEVFS